MRVLRRSYLCWPLLMIAVLWSRGAAAQPSAAAQASGTSAPPVTTDLRTQLGLTINNLGVQQSLEWSRRRLLAPDAGPLRSDAHLQFGATAAVSPSYARLGVWGQVAPLSIFVVRAGVEPDYFFGTFNSLMSFDRKDEPFDTDTRKARGGATSGTAWRAYVTPTLRVRVGHLVAAATADIERWASSAEGPLFYEPSRDTLLKVDGGSVIAVRHVALYEHVKASGARVSVGALHTLQRVDRSRLNQVQKLGALVVAETDGRFAGLSRPSATIFVARYLDDPSKDGEWTVGVAIAATLRRR